jgi:polysaccharide pyruvyl transferase WcaK-like protein
VGISGVKAPVAVLFANLKGNIGDFAILHSMLIELADRFPGHPLHVFSHGFHQVDERRLAAMMASGAPAFQLAGRTYAANRTKRLERLGRLLRIWPAIQAQLVRSLAARADGDAARFASYEAVFLAGGAQWGGTRHAISMFGTLQAVSKHNDRVFTFPFSTSSKMRRFNTTGSLRRYFSRIQRPILVRDGTSKSVMDEIGVSAVLGADCVFSMQDMSGGIDPAAGRDRSRVLVVVTGTGRQFAGDLRSALQRIAASGREVALLTTCEIDDGPVLEPLARELGIPYYAPATWQQAVAEMKASSLVVANRLHGLIFGCFARTPLLPVIDRTKVAAFVKDAGMPHSAAGLHALTPELLNRSMGDRDAILERMSSYASRARGEVRSPLAARQ